MTFIFAASEAVANTEPVTLRQRLPFLLLIKWPEKLFLRLTFPEAVTLTLLAKPLCVFCFGIRPNLSIIKKKRPKPNIRNEHSNRGCAFGQ